VWGETPVTSQLAEQPSIVGDAALSQLVLNALIPERD
jgi:hypothetical protein